MKARGGKLADWGLAAALMASTTLVCADASPSITKETTMESAKRRAPAAKPVVHEGIRYEQLRRPQEHGFSQGGGVIGAFNESTRVKVWAVQLYETAFDPKEERDAQEVYVSDLKIDAKAKALIAVDERKRRWRIQLSDGSVTQIMDAPAKK